ncbi:MAG: cell division protein FtsZ [Bacteroidetes bacterium]|nr:cell division protein FtsZ [Bacteroidota bacterium]
MQFELPEEQNQKDSSIIKVIGVGGGGSNAVNHMARMGIAGVSFAVCNTDKQALEKSPVNNKIQLGSKSTKGLGAGSIPEIGKEAALESIEDIKLFLSDGTQMVFVTAGLGGGTGTGAAPVIASIAKSLDILTVGIVTMPFSFEGKKRKMQAEQGLEELKKYVDTIIVIGNDRLREIYGNLKMSEAFAHADNVLTNAAKSIAEIIGQHMHINVDFNDVRTVMKDSGVSIMGSAVAGGEKRAIKAVEQALNSPLLNDNDISGARHILLNIMSGSGELDMDEYGEITDYIQESSGGTAELIMGYGTDPSLGDNVSVTIVATGFNSKIQTGFEMPSFIDRKVIKLEEEKIEPIVENKQTIFTDTPPVNELFSFTKETKLPEVEKNDVNIVSIDNVDDISIKDEIKITVHQLEEEAPVNKIELDTTVTEFTFNDISNDETVDKSTENSVVFHNTPKVTDINNREEQIKLAQERIRKLKELTLKMKSPEGLASLEKQTAFERKNISLDNSLPSKESSVSKFALGENDEKKIELRPNRTLHDNVD